VKRLAILVAAGLAACAAVPYPSPEDFATVVPGMTQAQVRAAFGEPARIEAFARLREVAWDFPVRDPWGYQAFQVVIFDASGKVTRKHYLRIEPNDQ
jgi:hypothetical protein